MDRKAILNSRNGRISSFGLLYISEGIPYGFTSIAMVTFMRQAEMPLDQIGIFVATLFLPWSFKFAWAPIVDLVPLKRIGGRKAWIIGSLTMILSSLTLVSFLDFKQDFQLLLVLMFINNFFCATQDVAIDSLAVTTLKPDERASGNGFMFGGQYFGIALGGGLAIYISSHTSFDMTLLYVTVMQALCLLYVVLFVYDPMANTVEPKIKVSLAELIHKILAFTKEVYISFWRSGAGPKVGFAFSLMPIGALVLGYAALSTIPVDYGFDETKIAQISTLNTIFGALGCIVGGLLADRFGIRKMLMLFYGLTTIPGLVLAVYISIGSLQAIPASIVAGCLVIHGFVYGMAFGTHAAIFMGLTNPAVAATQFTAYMAMGNVVISYTNYWQGVVGEALDYATVLYIDALLALLVILVIPHIRFREET